MAGSGSSWIPVLTYDAGAVCCHSGPGVGALTSSVHCTKHTAVLKRYWQLIYAIRVRAPNKARDHK